MANEKLEILKLLISRREESFSIRKISQIREINYKSAHNALKGLESEGLASLKKIGNTTACSFNNNFNELVFQAECQRRGEALRDKNILILYNRLSELKFPFIALLFGSHAKGKAMKHSDIDILTIGGEQKEIKSEISLFPDKIHLASIGYDEFVHMAKSREFSVVSEAIKNNIILIGIEEYYRLLT